MDVKVQLAEAHEGKSKEEKSSVLDVEVERFSQYMAGLADPMTNGPLNNPERALVKSYLVFKLAGKEQG